ncbi:MAG: nucleoside deaminase [Vicinamibacteria bacterium]
MRRCLELARWARAEGNTPVGSVVVLAGQIVGEGSEELPKGNDPTGHAEVLACRNALVRQGRSRLEGAVLYSTAEPCFMCSYVIRASGIAAVVYGVAAPHVGGATSVLPVLNSPLLDGWRPAPRVQGGVLAEECRTLCGI